MHISLIRALASPLALAIVLMFGAGPRAAAAGEHRIGLGLHYWKTVDDLAGDHFTGIDDSGQALVGSYQYRPQGLLRFEVDVELHNEGFGGSTGSAITPLVWVLVGKGLYGGVGAGLTFADDFGGSVSDPFFAARVGFEFGLLPKLTLDINGNYRAGAFNELDGADTDAITLAAIARFSL